jgi:hypothetical protein
MARLIGIHQVELKPGVTEEEFIEAVNAFYRIDQVEGPNGWFVAPLKSNRGTEVGSYAILFEVESVEVRDRWMADDGPTELANQFAERHPEFWPAWDHVMSLVVESYPWNDYVIV